MTEGCRRVTDIRFGNGGGVWRYVLSQHYFWAGITAGLCRRNKINICRIWKMGKILLKGKLTGKEQKNEQYLYNLSSCQIRQDSKISEWQHISASIIIYGESDTCSIGQTLVLHGKIKLFNRARNEGNFDQAAYYKARGTAFAVSDVDGVSAYGKANLIAEKMYQWKYHLAGVYEQALGVREGGVLSTMLLGEKIFWMRR